MIYAKKQIDNSIQDIKETSLFPTLPKPKAGGKVKITIPSLNEVFLFSFKWLNQYDFKYFYFNSFMMMMMTINQKEKLSNHQM